MISMHAVQVLGSQQADAIINREDSKIWRPTPMPAPISMPAPMPGQSHAAHPYHNFRQNSGKALNCRAWR